MTYHVESQARSEVMPIFNDFESAIDFAMMAGLQMKMNHQAGPVIIWHNKKVKNKMTRELTAFVCMDTHKA